MRMGIAFSWRAMRCPARMGDAEGAFDLGFLRQIRKCRYPPDAAQSMQSAIDDSQAGRVIPSVLELSQPLEQNGHDVAAGYGGDDSTHRS